MCTQHPPSPIRVLAIRMKNPWVLSYPLSTQRRLWSWAHMSFCWFCHGVAQVINYSQIVRASVHILFTDSLDHFRLLTTLTFDLGLCLSRHGTTLHIWATSWENLFLPDVNNRGADQSVHPCSLISAFIVRCLDSVIPLLAIAEISSP